MYFSSFNASKFKFTLLSLVIVLSTFSVLNSCKKEFSNESGFYPKPDLGDAAQTLASISGAVFDENYQPVSNAKVSIGNNWFMTNEQGFFYFDSIETSMRNTVIKIEKTGFFTQFKSTYVAPYSEVFIKAGLLTKKLVGSIESTKGGTITLASGGSIQLAANSILNFSDKTPYNGKVNIYAAWMDPSLPSVLDQMPGDLRGVTKKGTERPLITFGMMNVELESETNQKLQLDSSSPATLVYPVPNALLNSATSMQPLWHFDEKIGRWVEEGSAKLVGNTYLATVSHFSCWNVDAVYDKPLIKFCVTLVDENKKPFSSSHLLIRRPEDGWGAHGYTNCNGRVCGLIPSGTNLIFELLGEKGCEQKLYSVSKGPFSGDVDLDTLVISRVSEKNITVKGTATDCTNKPVKKGFVQATIRSLGFVGKIENGKFEFTISKCPQDQDIIVFGVDGVTKKLSDMKQVKINGKEIDLGNLVVCSDPAVSINNSLVAHYPFDGHGMDVSQNALNGVFIGNPKFVADRKGLASKAVHFNYLDTMTEASYLEVPNSATKNPLPLSLSFWCKIDDGAKSGSNLFRKYVPALWNGIQVLLERDDPNQKYYLIPWYLNSTVNRIIGDYGEPTYKAEVKLNQWHHFVFTVDNTDSKIYLDNKLIATKKWTGTARACSNNLNWIIGGFYSDWFQGSMDEVRIYNRALLQEEIKYLFEQ